LGGVTPSQVGVGWGVGVGPGGYYVTTSGGGWILGLGLLGWVPIGFSCNLRIWVHLRWVQVSLGGL
jgi:hypothetical protein